MSTKGVVELAQKDLCWRGLSRKSRARKPTRLGSSHLLEVGDANLDSDHTWWWALHAIARDSPDVRELYSSEVWTNLKWSMPVVGRYENITYIGDIGLLVLSVRSVSFQFVFCLLERHRDLTFFIFIC